MNTKAVTAENTSIVSGIMLLAGTCIGAGMLALPVVTGVAGFYPSLLISTCCWLVMLCTGLLFLEATLWMEKETNLLSMAHRFLGLIGKVIGGITFLFLYYCLEVSYISGGAPLFQTFFQALGLTISNTAAFTLFTGLIGAIVYFGIKAIDRVNWLLVSGLVLSYVMLVTVGSKGVQAKLLMFSDWKLCFFAAPTLFSAYGYHNVIPSLASMMKQNASKLRLTIIIGTAIPFVTYTIWQWLIMGTLTHAQLSDTATHGQPINLALQTITGNPWIVTFSAFFGFFALTTSLLGVSLSMVDFLADGIKVANRGINRLLLCGAVFLPSAIFAAYNPGIFIKAIGFAGGFGEAILNGLFPILMVWVGRYKMKLASPYQLPGGRLSLIGLTGIIASIIILELAIL